jgi:UDP-N-acetylglucosamine acyltransferase
MAIHPTAIIEGEIDIAPDVEIGPYTILRGKIKIGAGTRIDPHVTLGSKYSVIEMGEGNHVWSGAVLGGAPQDLSYKNEENKLIIGNYNTFREFVTVHIGTTKGGGVTKIGNNCYFMTTVHIGHDCQIGDRVVIATDSHLGGHTVFEDDATIGGVCAFNQFVRVGKCAFVGGGSVVVKDILPFSRAQGNHAICRASNKIGMQRKGYSQSEIESLHKAIRIILMGSATIQEGIERVRNECEPSPALDHFIHFIQTSKRGIAK